MKFVSWICTFFSALLLFADQPSSFERTAKETVLPQTIHVLLEKEVDEALLEVRGPYYLFDPQNGSRITAGLLDKRFMIRELASGLKWGEKFSGIHQFYVKPRSPDTSIFINGIQYSGSVYFYGVGGKLHIVNEIDIESYVKAVLTTQFPTPMEPEVMAAVAIAARTSAYYKALKGRGSFWHVDAKEEGYMGSALIVARSPIERAVDSTKQLILLYSHEERNSPFLASWTEHSAGKTAAYEAIFRRSEDGPQGVEAPHAKLARQESKWSYQISKKAFCSLFHLSSLNALELFCDASSGKVYALRCNKGGNESSDIEFVSLQRILGKEHLLSSDFTVTLKDDQLLFAGYGKGHGVGLCLYSASALVQNGENAVKILNKFFPETYLCNVGTLPSVR
ncbi:MAG: hypothetical protein KGI80_00245 [Verrucomicrobiota bacterium]|nr:hypothetical protein [Verrucomicrobiota bacterium]